MSACTKCGMNSKFKANVYSIARIFFCYKLETGPKTLMKQGKDPSEQGRENCEILNRVGTLPDRTNRLLKKQIPEEEMCHVA